MSGEASSQHNARATQQVAAAAVFAAAVAAVAAHAPWGGALTIMRCTLGQITSSCCSSCSSRGRCSLSGRGPRRVEGSDSDLTIDRVARMRARSFGEGKVGGGYRGCRAAR